MNNKVKVQYPYKSKLMSNAIKKKNRRGDNIFNDGTKYILCVLDFMDNIIYIGVFKSRSDGRALVRFHKNSSDVYSIIIQKGNNAVEHNREDGKWKSHKL